MPILYLKRCLDPNVNQTIAKTYNHLSILCDFTWGIPGYSRFTISDMYNDGSSFRVLGFNAISGVWDSIVKIDLISDTAYITCINPSVFSLLKNITDVVSQYYSNIVIKGYQNPSELLLNMVDTPYGALTHRGVLYTMANSFTHDELLIRVVGVYDLNELHNTICDREQALLLLRDNLFIRTKGSGYCFNSSCIFYHVLGVIDSENTQIGFICNDYLKPSDMGLPYTQKVVILNLPNSLVGAHT